MLKIEIDVVAVDLQDWMDLLRDMAKYDLHMKVVETFGPAGGNPVVSLQGTKENLEKWLVEIYQLEPEDLPDYIVA